MTSKHIKFCEQNTAMPYYVKIHFARHQHNTERTQNRAGYYNHRQLSRPFGGSSVWCNNQRKLWWKISAHSDFCKSPDLEPSTAKSERAWKSPHARKARRGGEGRKWGTTNKAKLLNLCVTLTTQNSDWLFHGNLSTSVKNAPAAMNTRHNHNLNNKSRTNNSTEPITRVALVDATK